MSKIFIIVGILVLGLTAVSAQKASKDMTELMRLHEQHKTAHMTNNVDLFVDTFADKVTQIQNGGVFQRTKEESRERFKIYFASFKFEEWADIKPPIIKISNDGKLATKIVEKRVRGTYKYPDGKVEKDHTAFAWVEVWEKIDGKWKVISIASTSKQGKDQK
jgi:hypothetical protein